MIESFYSKKSVEVGSIIIFDNDKERKYKVMQCICLSYFGKEGFQLNVVEVL